MYTYWRPAATATRRGFKNSHTFVGGTCVLPSAFLVCGALYSIGLSFDSLSGWAVKEMARKYSRPCISRIGVLMYKREYENRYFRPIFRFISLTIQGSRAIVTMELDQELVCELCNAIYLRCRG